MSPSLTRVACIGECMIELSELGDGRLSRTHGGDTLNTAVYLARLGVEVDYVTALGDDHFSDEMLAGWRREGVGTALVPRLPGRLPGLYLIRRDASGERSFFYWRDRAPARELFDLPETPAICDALAGFRAALLLRHHAVALWRGRARAVVPGAGADGRLRRSHRVRHQLPSPWLARSRGRPGRLPPRH